MGMSCCCTTSEIPSNCSVHLRKIFCFDIFGKWSGLGCSETKALELFYKFIVQNKAVNYYAVERATSYTFYYKSLKQTIFLKRQAYEASFETQNAAEGVP